MVTLKIKKHQCDFIKILFFSVILLLVNFSLYPFDKLFLDKIFSDPDSDSTVLISRNKIRFVWADSFSGTNKEVEEYKIDIKSDENYSIISSNENEYTLFYTDALHNVEFLTLISNKEKNYGDRKIFNFSISINSTFLSYASLSPVQVKTANTYFSEFLNSVKIDYFPSLNDNEFSLDNYPWVTKTTDILPWIEFTIPGGEISDMLPINELIICNGFFQPSRQDLFKQNARVRNIKIVYKNEEFFTTLQDKQGYQTVLIPWEIAVGNVSPLRIYIIDSYSGSMYNDVAISGIFFYTARLKRGF